MNPSVIAFHYNRRSEIVRRTFTWEMASSEKVFKENAERQRTILVSMKPSEICIHPRKFSTFLSCLHDAKHKRKLRNHFRLQTFLFISSCFLFGCWSLKKKKALRELRTKERTNERLKKIALSEVIFMSRKIPEKDLVKSFSCSKSFNTRALKSQREHFFLRSEQREQRSYEQTFFSEETVQGKYKKLFSKLHNKERQNFLANFHSFPCKQK